MSNRNLWLWATLLAALAVAGLIFYFSAQPADDSSEMSAEIVEPVLHTLYSDFDAMPVSRQTSLRDTVTFIVRKLAHFGIFAVLGFFLAAHVRLRRPDWPGRTVSLTAWAAAVLYAGTDELHQLFVEGRSAELRDLGIDAAGALCGVLAIALLGLLLRRRHKKSGG